MPHTRVPTDRLTPFVKEYLDSYETEETLNATSVLADEIGMGYEFVRKLYNGRGNASVSFDVADRLLCKMGRTDLWLFELSDIYQSIDLSYIDERDPCVKDNVARMAA